MSTRQTAEPPHLPSLRRLATAKVLALLTAVVILAAFVLPAEYGIDPLRTGRALGLTDLASATEPAAKPTVVTNAAAKTFIINPTLVPSPSGGAPTMRDTFIAQPGRFQFHHRAYGRIGEPCTTCETPMRSVQVGGRTSTFCPSCQIRNRVPMKDI